MYKIESIGFYGVVKLPQNLFKAIPQHMIIDSRYEDILIKILLANEEEISYLNALGVDVDLVNVDFDYFMLEESSEAWGGR